MPMLLGRSRLPIRGWALWFEPLREPNLPLSVRRRSLAPHALRRTRQWLAGRGSSWLPIARLSASPPGSLTAGTRAAPLNAPLGADASPSAVRGPGSAERLTAREGRGASAPLRVR